jgi:uncharacterized iron-regulated protein
LRATRLLGLLLSLLLTGGCAMKPAQLKIQGIDHPLAVDTILDTATGRAITFDQLMDQLAPARVVYVGERHTSAVHHDIQLRVIKTLVERGHPVSVGMEMFDHTYQPRLDQWSRGELDYDDFLKLTHWYANWKFDDALYKEILLYIKEKRIALWGLNIPFHLPRKIAIGGLDSLTPAERGLVPESIDMTNADHRSYLEEIFGMHKTRGRDDFDNFYAAQCAWEDGMASAVARNLGAETMVVLAGNGHIMRHFGIPDRAFRRTRAPFRTLYLATPKMAVSRKDGDFIWVTPQRPPSRRPTRMH